MSLTKMEMATVIVTALYNFPKLVTEKNRVQFNHARRIARARKKDMEHQYALAIKILSGPRSYK